MTLLVPLGLLALLALPIIVWLHLIHERRRRVVVPSLLLWQHVPRKPDARRRLKLPLTLLLALHLLAAALLALALSQPQWLGGLLGGSTNQAIIVDTSTSMAANDGGGTRLDQARDRARSLINGLGGNDELTLIAAGPQASVLATGGVENRASLLAALDTLAVDGTGTDIAGAFTLAQAALDDDNGGTILVLSDGALPALEASLANGAAVAPLPPTIGVEWVAIGANLDNQGIVSFAARSRQNSSATDEAVAYVYARVANYSSNGYSTRLRLFGDDQLLDTRDVSLAGDNEAEFTWTAPPGIAVLRAELEGDDALPADNAAYLSLAQLRPINTLLVSEEPGALERALRAVPGTNLVVVAPGNYAPDQSPARDADLTVFDRMLPERWPAGGVLVINPPSGTSALLNVGTPVDLDADGLAPVLQMPARTAGQTNRLLEGLNLDSVQFGIVTEVAQPDWATVELAANGFPLILQGSVEQSEVAIWTFDLAGSNLTERLAFPLLVARTVRDLTPLSLPSALLAGEILPLHPSPRTTSIAVEPPDGETRQVDALSTMQVDGLTQPGVYTIVEQAGDTTLYRGRTAVNAGSPLESDLRPRALPSDLGVIAGITIPGMEGESARREQQPIWSWIAIAALVVMVIEWVYVHR